MLAASVTGAILAGGPNTGMSGNPKAFMQIGDEVLIRRQIRIMRELCNEIIVVTNTPKPFFNVLDSSVRLITDYFPGGGPVAGMHAALHLARNRLVWIASCEMPFLSSEVARRLISGRNESCDAVIPIVRSRPVALHGVYDKSCAEEATKLLSARAADLKSFIGRIRWLGIGADGWTKDAGIGEFDCVIRDEADHAHVQQLLRQRSSYDD